jgi:hypothetical protein
MKILILVLSSDKDPYKFIREEGQEKTWDSIEVPGVETIYYFSSVHYHATLFNKRLTVNCSDDFYVMHWRLKLALDYVWDREWDYIFRTSASSYIDKELLLQKAESLPKEKCYCGIQCCGGSVASGCGFFMSRDVVDILRHKIPSEMHNAPYGVHPDDVLVGKILEANDIWLTEGADRYDYYHTDQPLRKTYHYRCKKDDVPNDGKHDVEAMHTIHNFLNANRETTTAE